MFWGTFSVLSIVISALLSSAAPHAGDGPALVQQSSSNQATAGTMPTGNAWLRSTQPGSTAANVTPQAGAGSNAGARPAAGPANAPGANVGRPATPAAGATTFVIQPATRGSRLYGFDTSVGSAAPPDTLGGYILTPFGPDPTATFVDVTSIAGPCPTGGSITFSAGMNHRVIGSGWMSWSHGYTGDVYYNNMHQDVVVTLPMPSCAIYFYIEPDPFTPEHTFTITANDGTSATFAALGSAGAAYCGIFGTGLNYFTIHDNDSVGYAIGEFALACFCEPVYRACCYEAVPPAYCVEGVEILDCISTGGRWDIDATLCTELDPPCGEYTGACCYGPDADPGYEPYQCIGDMIQSDCLYLSEYTNWTGGASCSDPGFLCPGTPTYCDASGGCDEYIAHVQMNDIDNSTGCDQYADYTTLWTLVVPGVYYPITVTNGTPYSADSCSVWVDWNQDKTFNDDGSEWIGDVVGGGVSPPYHLNMTAPGDAFGGYTRMRIRIDYANPDPDPCGTTTYGEVEDYSLLVAGCPGACCNIRDGTCLDFYFGADCVSLGPDWRFHGGEQLCYELNPPCGDPGCCCDAPESGVVTDPHFAYRANCNGRFFSGVLGGDCSAEAFSPACGLWQPTGVMYAPTNPDNSGFRAAVSALLNSPVDYFDARVGTPTPEQLEPYAAVLTWGNYAYSDKVAMGDVLADFVDANGKVILGQWTFHTHQVNWLEGRIMTAAYCPVATMSGYGGGTYLGDGTGCVFHGPAGDVVTLAAQYGDIIETVQAGAVADGHWSGGGTVVAYWPQMSVYYSSGNTGSDFSSGAWAILTANMVLCTPGPGACCDRSTAECIDQLAFVECQAHGPAWQWRMGYCAELTPVCGNPGACCDLHTGACIDDVFEYNCRALDREFRTVIQCGELEPACGDPGCCCESPEPGTPVDPHFAYRANCNGRFVSGATPLCGDLDGNGLVDMTDYNMFLDAFGKCASQPGFVAAADLDGDGCVSLVNFQMWRNCYENPGTGCEPWSFSPNCGRVPTGLLYAIADPDDAAYRAAISALIGRPVDYFDAISGTPTVAEMSAYAAVMCWVNYPLADNVAMGNNLADYVDQGGQAILGQWCFPTAGNYLAGRIMTADYCPASSGAGWGGASYTGPGLDCFLTLYPVNSLSNTYVDVITGLVAGSQSDGVFSNGSPVAAWRPDRKVVYSAGNMSMQYGLVGQWAELTANYVLCSGPVWGACCNQYTAECTDDTLPSACSFQWFYHGTCDELNPPCGDPGCCCDAPEGGADPHYSLRANCYGRFLSGVLGEDCVSSAFTPDCWQPWVELLYAPTNPDNAGFRAAVAALLNSDVVYYDARVGTPTLAQLTPYAAVFTWGNYAYADKVAMGNVLADFVDVGGKVILGQWCYHTHQVNWLEGRIMTAEYCPAVCSDYLGASYGGDGTLCPFDGPTGTVGSLTAQYADVTQPAAGAFADGTMGAGVALAFWPAFDVYYSPGNTGNDFSAGDWATLTANMVLCTPGPGACCNRSTGECIDDILFIDCVCSGPVWHWRMGDCATLVPPCGNPGACCDVYTGNCIDDVLEYNCAGEPHAGQACAELNPECGDPGCCCDSPESGVPTDPHFAYHANCSGRFISGLAGVDCLLAAFTPECGFWQPTGMLYAPGEADAPAFRAAISALIGQPVHYFDARIATPTFEQMSQYAAVLTWVNYPLADKVAMGNNLADYVDSGGRAILGQWCFPTAGNFLAGRIMTADYCPASSGAGWGSASYSGPGMDCVTVLNPVTALTTSYCDVITGLVAGSGSDGTYSNGTPVAAWRPDREVYYSAGNMGAMYGATGQWAELTANYVICSGCGLCGCCCDIYEAAVPGGPGYCVDDESAVDCAAPQRFYWDQTCAELDPPCGDPGACCDDLAAECVDGVLAANCDGRHLSAPLVCADFSPACGEVCQHSIDMYDSYGDGWNGNTLDVFVDGNLVLSAITLPSGSGPLSFNFMAGTGSEIHTVYNAIGGWPFEPYYMIYDGLGLLIIQDGGDFILPTGVTVAGNCEPIYGACCDGLTGVCEDNVSIFDCTGQFTEDAQCAELTPPCGNPGACCDDVAIECVDGVMQLACSFRFAAATLCAVLDPECGQYTCEDAQLVAPGSWSGNTCGAGNDCALRSSEDLIVKVTIPTDANWQFALCGTPVWDTYLYVGNDCCEGTWYDDDGCGTVLSRIQRPALPAGIYYATIEAYSSACGAVTLAVATYEPEDRSSTTAGPGGLEELTPAARD